jgi:hypothetical protein
VGSNPTLSAKTSSKPLIHRMALALALAGQRLVLPAPVHERDQQVGAKHAAGAADVEAHLLVLAPGYSGLVGVGLEVAREELVVAQQRDAQPLALDHQRRVCAGQVEPAAEVADARPVQQPEHLGKRRRAEIARMVVGQAHRVETALQHLERARMGAEGVRLVRLRKAGGGDDTFQVADADVGGGQLGGKGLERVAPPADDAPGRVVEHQVADEDHRDPLCRRLGPGGGGRRGGGQAEQAGQQQPDHVKQRLHGCTSSSAHP